MEIYHHLLMNVVGTIYFQVQMRNHVIQIIIAGFRETIIRYAATKNSTAFDLLHGDSFFML
jgi:hypothetical protein